MMKTVKLFDTLPYEDCFEAKVLSCQPIKDGYELVLDQTGFFPEEGGQDADKGVIIATGISQEIPVLDVQIKDDVIYHKISTLIPEGTKVKGCIDYDRRFDYMQQHTGEHMLCGIANALWGCENVGFHLSEREVTFDLDKALTDEQVSVLEQKVNEAIYKNTQVKTYYPSKDELDALDYRSKKELTGAVRIVEIVDVDMCACCAPHVSSTGQVGIVKIVGYEPHRGGMRFTICCGKRALIDYIGKQNITGKASALLSVPIEKIGESIQRVQQEVVKMNDRRIKMQQRYLELLLSSVNSADENVFVFTEELDTQAVRDGVNELVKNHSGYCGIFTGNDEEGYNFIVGSSVKDCRELANLMRNELKARCGGSQPMIQGSVSASSLEIRNIL